MCTFVFKLSWSNDYCSFYKCPLLLRSYMYIYLAQWSTVKETKHMEVKLTKCFNISSNVQ